MNREDYERMLDQAGRESDVIWTTDVLDSPTDDEDAPVAVPS